ncbi:MAG: CsiV family protein [Pseudomonadota bacterium]
MRPLFFLLLIATSAFAQTPAPAPDTRYRVDLILFLDKQGAETPGNAQALEVEQLLEPDDAPTLESVGIQRLPESETALAKELQQLRRSKRYQPLTTLSWIQKNPPAERGPALHLRWGQPLSANGVTLNTVDGSVALLLGQYLRLDVDLNYNSLRSDGTLGSVPLKERRRMKRDELHYLDSPKLGVLAKITRLKAAR